MSNQAPLSDAQLLKNELRLAIWSGEAAKIQDCITRGATLAGMGDEGPALWYAFHGLRADIVTLLLENGANPNELYEDRTPLSYLIDPSSIDPNATEEKLAAIAVVLLQYGAKPGLLTRDRCISPDRKPSTPLQIAVSNGYIPGRDPTTYSVHHINGIIGALIDAAEKSGDSLGWIYSQEFNYIFENFPPERIRQLIQMKAVDLMQPNTFEGRYDGESYQRNYCHLDAILLNGTLKTMEFALEALNLTDEKREFHLSMALYWACERSQYLRALDLIALGANVSRAYRYPEGNWKALKNLIEWCPPDHREDKDPKGLTLLTKLNLHNISPKSHVDNGESLALERLALECGFHPWSNMRIDPFVTTRAEDFSRVLAFAEVCSHPTAPFDLTTEEAQQNPLFLFKNLPVDLQSQVVSHLAAAPTHDRATSTYHALSRPHVANRFFHLRKNMTVIKQKLEDQKQWRQSFVDLKTRHQALIENSISKKYRETLKKRTRTGYFSIFHGERAAVFKKALACVEDPMAYLQLFNLELSHYPGEATVVDGAQYPPEFSARLSHAFKRTPKTGRNGYYHLLKLMQKEIQEWIAAAPGLQPAVQPVAQNGV